MSQERVLTLLYDKTFPPRSQSVGFTGQLGTNFGNTGMSRAGTQSANKIGLKQVDSMHQFNYFGSTPGGNMAVNAFDEDVELLEREIETVMMREGDSDSNIRAVYGTQLPYPVNTDCTKMSPSIHSILLW